MESIMGFGFSKQKGKLHFSKKAKNCSSFKKTEDYF